jgi:homoserine acetyltransferase
MEILLKGKLEKTAADGSLATDNLVFDETVNVGSFVSEQEVKDGLNKMRKQMATYRTPSLQHTAFSKNAANKRHYANFDMSDFYLVWNDKLYTNISDLTSNLFNKEDILLKAGKTIHQQFELVGSPTNNEKTAYNKIVAFAVHKDALKEIVPGEMATEILKANFQTVTRFLVMYGHGRIGKFPIVKFITSN